MEIILWKWVTNSWEMLWCFLPPILYFGNSWAPLFSNNHLAFTVSDCPHFFNIFLFQVDPVPACQKKSNMMCKKYMINTHFFGLQLEAFFLNLVYFHGEYFRVNQLLVKHSLRIIWIFVLSFLFFMIIRRILTCHTRRCIQRWRCCRPRLDRLSQRFRRGLDMRFLIIIIYHNLLFWSRLFRRFFAMTETIVLSPSHHFFLL